MSDRFVKSRLVFNFQGFEGSSSDMLLNRVNYCAHKTADLWDVSLDVTAIKHHQNESYSEEILSSKGDDWAVETRFIQPSFGDLLLPYYERFDPKVIVTNIINLCSFIFDGTLFKYYKHSILFGSFLSFPIVFTVLFAGLSYLMSNSLLTFLGISGLFFAIGVAILSVLIFFGLHLWPGHKFYYPLSMGLWGYTKDVAAQKHVKTEARCDALSKLMIAEIQAKDYDEILFVGQSLGTVWAPMALSRALKQRPKLLKNKRVTFISLGGVTNMVSLVPDAKFFRLIMKQLLEVKEIFWHDFQCKDDPANFYKSDVFKVLNLGLPPAGYQISRVNFKHSMTLKRYREMKKSIYDTHRQYGLYQDKCISFDYFLRVLGPCFAQDIANDPDKTQLINFNKDVIIQQGVFKQG
jgi:hypothetical protein